MASRAGRRLGAALAWWVSAATRAAPWVVGLWLLATGMALNYTMDRLGIDTDTVDMLSAELPFRQTYERYKRLFPEYVDTLLVVIDGTTPELVERAAETLTARLEARGELFKTVYRPGAGSFFEKHGLLYLSTVDLENLADNLARIQPFLAKLIRDRSLRGLLAMLGSALKAVREGETLDLKPILWRLDEALQASLEKRFYRLSWQALMLGEEASAEPYRRFVIVQPRLDYSEILAAQPAMEEIRRLAKELDIDQSRGLRLRITGEVAMSHEELETVFKGTSVFGLVALAMIAFTLFVGLRSLRLTLITLLSLVSGLILTAAFATTAVGHLNLISVAFAVLYIGLGIDFAIHLCLRYEESLQAGGPVRTALSEAARDIGPALVLCALTTAIGFYAFIPTAYAGVSELGLIAGTGMFISLALTLTVLPALLRLWRSAPPGKWRTSRYLRDRLVELPAYHGKAVRRATLLIAAGALLLLPQVRFDYNPLHLRNPQSESVSTFQDLLAESSTPPWSIVVLAPTLKAARDDVDRLRTLDAAGKVVFLYSFLPDDQAEKLAIIEDMALILGPQLLMDPHQASPDLETQRKAIRDLQSAIDAYLAAEAPLPWSDTVARLDEHLERVLQELQTRGREGQAQLLARLQRSLMGLLPDTLERLRVSLDAGPVTLNDLPAELRERWVSPEGIYRIEVYPNENLDNLDALRRFVDAVRRIAPNATGTPVLMLESAEAVIGAFLQAFATALLCIGLLLWIMLRSLKDTVLVLVPLLLGGLLTGAMMVLLHVPFNFANVIALPLLLGIGVDNGIHILHRIRSAPASQTPLLRTSTTRAVLFSALTTALGFGNLGLSPHPGTASMGQILAIGVLLTLIATFVVLPALLNPQTKPS